jgi:CDP-diacylglycerol--serine O-phosphatidyltransferase
MKSPRRRTPLAIPKRKLNLRKTLFLLPNIITLSSIFCGFDAIRLTASGRDDAEDFYRASILLVFALIFDLLDGRVARLTKTQSAFGLQIDSLADVISFGVAPALLVYKWSLYQEPLVGLIVSFLFAGMGAVRLARFNVLSMDDGGKPTKPGKYIVGLPVPGAAGILISLILANHAAAGGLRGPSFVWPLMGLTLFLSFLMVSGIRFRSFKDIKLNAWSVGLVCFAIGSSALVSMKTKPAFVLVWLLSFYVLMGIIEFLVSLTRRRARTSLVPERPSLPPVPPVS